MPGELIQAFFSRETTTIQTKLQDIKATWQDENGQTLMHWCVASGYTAALPSLIDAGVSLNTENYYDLSPLHLAILLEQTSMVKQLMDSGQNKYPFKCSLKYFGQTQQVKLHGEHLAIAMGQVAGLKTFMQRKDFKRQFSGIDNVFLAVYFEQPAILDQLLVEPKTQAQIEGTLKVEDVEVSLLDFAAGIGSIGCLHTLLRHYANTPDIGQHNQVIHALLTAIECQQSTSVSVLLHFGANPTKQLNIYRLLTPFKPNKKAYENIAANQFVKKIHNFIDSDLTQTIQNKLQNAADSFEANRHQFPDLKTRSVDNLVFQGGGVKGLAYVGVLGALESCLSARVAGMSETYQAAYGMSNIKRIGGASAGAITAVAVALGMDAKSLYALLKDAPFNTFMDGVDEATLKKLEETNALSEQLNIFANLLDEDFSIPKTTYGLLDTLKKLVGKDGICSGEKILNWFSGVINEHLKTLLIDLSSRTQPLTGEAQALHEALVNVKTRCKGSFGLLTLGDLHQLAVAMPSRFREVYLVASRLDDKQSIEVFTSALGQDNKWENVLVVDAVRASMSIPVIFVPYQLRERNVRTGEINSPSGPRYVDGGVLKNYPVELFDQYRFIPDWGLGNPDYPILNPNTLGMSLFTPARTPKVEAVAEPGILSRLWDYTRPVRHPLEFTKEQLMKQFIQPKMDEIKQSKGVALLKALAGFYQDAEAIQAAFSMTREGRTVDISNEGVKTLSFAIAEADQKALLRSGYEAVVHYFERQDAPSFEQWLASVQAPQHEQQEGQTLGLLSTVGTRSGSPLHQPVRKPSRGKEEEDISDSDDEPPPKRVKKEEMDRSPPAKRFRRDVEQPEDEMNVAEESTSLNPS